MKQGFGILLVLLVSSIAGLAQELRYDVPAPPVTNTVGFTFSKQFLLQSPEDRTTGFSDGIFLNDKVRVSGPLVHPLKSKNVLEVPARVLHLVNPFTKVGAQETKPRVERPGSRAWTTIVGWRPGQSAFADDTHHEPQIGLFSVGAGKKRSK